MEQQKSKGLAKVTKIASVEVYDPELLSKDRELVRINTVTQALALSDQYPEQYPSLATLRKYFDDEAVENIIKLYLIELTELVNLKRELTEKQIDVIAQNVVAQYYNLTIADVHVVFKQAVTGKYGSFYDALDVPKVMSWFSKYFDARCDAAMEESINNQFNDKGGNKTKTYYERYYNRLEKNFKRF